MQANQNIVVFQPRKSFKSTFIEILINTLEATAELTLLYLTYMQSTSCQMPGLDEAQAGINVARRNINNLR